MSESPITPSQETVGQYTVVARRYRPKSFGELVGQDTVVQALSTAIATNRVGHAYLFTGARGVGKTSTARIFAKALNAEGGPTPEPDLDSDVSLAIDAGEDMDVIEVDGASNRGIEEIRQLRANVHVRPSRSRYKIYIIDEVHMLTVQAFNALLKTLEEPPEHVKFIFCTTDPEKIPITVLSRCQRFDFAPVQTEAILNRLKLICASEGAEADEAALRLLARKAAGSMRDSQSLLEQLISFSNDRITVDTVHAMLGTADESRLAAMVQHMIERNAASMLQSLDEACSSGVDPGQFGEQLLGYLRDMMAVGVGAGPDLLRTANADSYDHLVASAKSWGTSTLLASIQILDDCLVKMRHSVQSRILLEVAMVQICHLQDLQGLSDLIASLKSDPRASTGGSLPTAAPVVPTGSAGNPKVPDRATTRPIEKKKDELELDRMVVWRRALDQCDILIAECGRLASEVLEVESDHWKVVLPAAHAQAASHCQENVAVFQKSISQLLGRTIRLTVALDGDPPKSDSTAKASHRTSSDRIREMSKHPFVSQLCETLSGEILRIDGPDKPTLIPQHHHSEPKPMESRTSDV